MKRKEPRVQSSGSYKIVFGRAKNGLAEFWINGEFSHMETSFEYPLGVYVELNSLTAREFCRTHKPPGVKKPREVFSDTERLDWLMMNGVYHHKNIVEWTRRKLDAAMRKERIK